MELRTQVKEQEERRVRNKEKFLKKKEVFSYIIFFFHIFFKFRC